ncbi:MAG: tripartite tricarboxylate transporter substrate binding protein [Lautropia sp.]
MSGISRWIAAIDRRRWLAAASVLLALCLPPLPASAQYPDRPIQLIVPFPAGGSVDIVARLFAQAASDAFKGRIVVLNKVGASALIGEAEVARSHPDGYTILFDAVTISINAAMYQKPIYDPDELQPVAPLLTLPFVVVTGPKVPADNLKDMIALARKVPGGISTAYAGASTMLAAHLLRLSAGIDLHLIAYTGGPPAAMAIMRDEAQLYVSDLPSVSQHIVSGKIKPLAISGTERAKQMPEIPTAAEAGLPQFQADSWFGVFARKGTPPEILAKLNEEISRFTRNPEIVARLEAMGGKPVQMSVAEFDEYYKRQRALWKDVIAKAGIPLQ